VIPQTKISKIAVKNTLLLLRHAVAK